MVAFVVPGNQVYLPTLGMDMRVPVVAIGGCAWTALRGKLPQTDATAPEPPAVEVEVWFYPPRAVAEGRVVDRLSLCLSLSGNKDERVESALDHLLEDMKR
jgi:hypothetical protein